MQSLADLPNVVLQGVSCHLPLSDLARIQRVCRRFRQSTLCDSVWRFAACQLSPLLRRHPNGWKAACHSFILLESGMPIHARDTRRFAYQEKTAGQPVKRILGIVETSQQAVRVGSEDCNASDVEVGVHIADDKRSLHVSRQALRTYPQSNVHERIERNGNVTRWTVPDLDAVDCLREVLTSGKHMWYTTEDVGDVLCLRTSDSAGAMHCWRREMQEDIRACGLNETLLIVVLHSGDMLWLARTTGVTLRHLSAPEGARVGLHVGVHLTPTHLFTFYSGVSGSLVGIWNLATGRYTRQLHSQAVIETSFQYKMHGSLRFIDHSHLAHTVTRGSFSGPATIHQVHLWNLASGEIDEMEEKTTGRPPTGHVWLLYEREHPDGSTDLAASLIDNPLRQSSGLPGAKVLVEPFRSI